MAGYPAAMHYSPEPYPASPQPPARNQKPLTPMQAMENSEDRKPDYCAACVEGVSLLNVAATVMTSNAQIITELASLHGALRKRAGVPNANTTASAVSGKNPIRTVDASGAGSLAVYQEIMKKNGHGRLGRTHMEDVDRLPDSARSELDIFLRRTILAMFPVSGSYTTIDADAVFAALSAFGLRLENRNPLADVTVFSDTCSKTTIERLQNFCAHYYTASTNNFASYWRASAMETLIELARYRGLFGNDGFLKAAE